MHHPRNQERLALKPSRVSIDQDKRSPSPGTKPASARRPGVGGTARGGSVARVPVEYVANLQQQIFFLERKLEAVGGVEEPGGGGSLKPGAGAIALSGGLRSQIHSLDAEYRAAVRSHEAQLQQLAQERHVAQLAEARALERLGEAARQSAEADAEAAAARQELTAEVVGLQQQLDRAGIEHRATREELKASAAACEDLRRLISGAPAEVRRLESKVTNLQAERLLSEGREEAYRRRLAEVERDHEALKLQHEHGVAKWDRRQLEVDRATREALVDATRRAERAELRVREEEERYRLLGERLDAAVEGESRAVERANELEARLEYAERDRDEAIEHTEKNKMVSVLSRMIIRKTRERMAEAEAAAARVVAGQDAMNDRVVHAEEVREAIDRELSQERQRHAIEREHYAQQDEEARAMTAWNRELEAQLHTMGRHLREARETLAEAEGREHNATARLKVIEGRHEALVLLSQLKVDDLKALAETQSGVSRAIHEQLLPALAQAMPERSGLDPAV
mmetsp:Transcript_34207/g.113215  ORF Transcript_34207/g.113215 Transcript_34207/m.113215 type:complete len:513 (-) Transcript_34207:183-1721(-)